MAFQRSSPSSAEKRERSLIRALAFCVVLAAPGLTGCSLFHRSPKPPKPPAVVVEPSPNRVLGRVLVVDLRTLTVIVEISPFARLPADLNGQILLTRTDDLRSTARLQSSRYLRGRTLGTRLIGGQPSVGDEVVIPSSSAQP